MTEKGSFEALPLKYFSESAYVCASSLYNVHIETTLDLSGTVTLIGAGASIPIYRSKLGELMMPPDRTLAGKENSLRIAYHKIFIVSLLNSEDLACQVPIFYRKIFV